MTAREIVQQTVHAHVDTVCKNTDLPDLFHEEFPNFYAGGLVVVFSDILEDHLGKDGWKDWLADHDFEDFRDIINQDKDELEESLAEMVMVLGTFDPDDEVPEEDEEGLIRSTDESLRKVGVALMRTMPDMVKKIAEEKGEDINSEAVDLLGGVVSESFLRVLNSADPANPFNIVNNSIQDIQAFIHTFGLQCSALSKEIGNEELGTNFFAETMMALQEGFEKCLVQKEKIMTQEEYDMMTKLAPDVETGFAGSVVVFTNRVLGKEPNKEAVAECLLKQFCNCLDSKYPSCRHLDSADLKEKVELAFQEYVSKQDRTGGGKSDGTKYFDFPDFPDFPDDLF